MKKDKLTYYQQMQHPLWQKKRLEVMSDHDFACQVCGAKDDQLNVHHPVYKRGAMIWDYNSHELECLCERCHKETHAIDTLIKHEFQHAVETHGFYFKSVLLGFIQGHCSPLVPEYYERPFYKYGYDLGHQSSTVVREMVKSIRDNQGD